MHRGYLLAPTAFFLVIACVVLFQFPQGSWVPVWRFADTPAEKALQQPGEAQSPADPPRFESTAATENHSTGLSTSERNGADDSVRSSIPGPTAFSNAQRDEPSPTVSESGDPRSSTILRRRAVTILVLGDVDSPGDLPWPNGQFPQTVLGAIRAAGGFGPLASMKMIRLIRAKDGKATTTIVDVIADSDRGQDLSPKVLPGDAIFVPRLPRNDGALARAGSGVRH